MALFDLNRTNDTPIATLKVSEIAPKVWNTPPAAITATMIGVTNQNAAKPRHTSASGDFTGGMGGDDIDQQTANVALARQDGAANEPNYAPRNQAAKAALPGTAPPNAIAGEPDFAMVADVTRPRGYYTPGMAYFTGGATVAAPTVTSVAPNTAAAGSQPINVIITGTNFFAQSKVITGGGAGSPWDAQAKWISTTQ